MLNLRTKRRVATGDRASARLAEIQASVSALVDDDLLDLADIFKSAAPTPLWDIAQAEMTRRDLKL
ncbi:hypothetical protein [Sphingomonas sp. PP-CE-3G-477]|uniref:hypothetical protein n=1 Tax=Sphingomonas sp. PP-CE-3G-477 TaxID=2135660 RepID=UPI000D3C3CDC|nr:hypothetical protein [Sphingomonas sp. PP-CE-3G-477]